MDSVEENVRYDNMHELGAAAQPLVDYLNTWGNPHSYVIVTQTSAELLSGECGVKFEPGR